MTQEDVPRPHPPLICMCIFMHLGCYFTLGSLRFTPLFTGCQIRICFMLCNWRFPYSDAFPQLGVLCMPWCSPANIRWTNMELKIRPSALSPFRYFNQLVHYTCLLMLPNWHKIKTLVCAFSPYFIIKHLYSATFLSLTFTLVPGFCFIIFRSVG